MDRWVLYETKDNINETDNKFGGLSCRAAGRKGSLKPMSQNSRGPGGACEARSGDLLVLVVKSNAPQSSVGH